MHTPDKVTTMVVQELFFATGPVETKALAVRLPALSSETIGNVLMKLTRIDVVVKTKDRDTTMYALSAEAKQMFGQAGIFDNVPSYDPFCRVRHTPKLVTPKKLVLRAAHR